MEPLELIVVGKETVAEDTVKLTLQRLDGGPLPAAQPGAHIVLDLEGLVRRYSLLRADAAPTHYEIGVLRAANSRGGSRFIHEQLVVGSRLSLLDVANEFVLDTDSPHVLLLGGGIGITPLLSMALHLGTEGRSFALRHVVRDAARQWPLPLPLPSGTPGSLASVHIGRASLDLRRLIGEQPPGTHVYVCGPAGFIDAVRSASSEAGWPAHRVHAESFGTGVDASDAPLRVTLTQSGSTLHVAPGTSLLDALLAAGVWTSYECCRGVCGACLTEVVRGEPVHRDSLAPDVRMGAMCTCVSWARGPELVLNL